MIDGRTFVLDAWPVLEFFRRRQPASQLFQEFLLQAAVQNSQLLLSRLNYGEIRYKALEYFGAQRTAALLAELPRYVTILPVDDMLVDEAALLKFTSRQGYADCFVAALAIRYGAAVVTGDPHFLKLQAAGLLTVHWLGQ